MIFIEHVTISYQSIADQTLFPGGLRQ